SPVVEFEDATFYMILRKCYRAWVFMMEYMIHDKVLIKSKNGDLYTISREDITQIKDGDFDTISRKDISQIKDGDFYMISQQDISQNKDGDSTWLRPEGSSYLKLHSSFPPEFRAKPGESWKDHWRSVEFWLASEGSNLPPGIRASRPMQQLKERAGKIVNHLSVTEVTGPDGVEVIRREMEKSPIIKLLEHKEVDKKRQKFMRLGRYPKESLESFINRASIYRHENDACQNYRVGTKFYLGHLMDAARLTRKDEALIKTASGGLHDEGRVINAMLELSEQLEGLPGYPIGRGEPELPDEDRYLVQKDKDHGDKTHRREDRGRRPFRDHRGGQDRRGRWGGRMKKLKQVFHAILEDNEDSDSADGSSSGSSRSEPNDEEARDGPVPNKEEDTSEGSMPAEVYAQEYKAKKKVNELKQMRQYFQRGNADKTKAWVKEQQKKVDESQDEQEETESPTLPTVSHHRVPEHHRMDHADEEELRTSWEQVGLEEGSRSETETKAEPSTRRRTPGHVRALGRLLKARSKSAENRKPRVRTERKATPSPRRRASRMETRSPQGTRTPTRSTTSSTTKAYLEAQAAELEEQLWPYMDPTSIRVEGSKATKAYWVEKIRLMEEELSHCLAPGPMELDKLSKTGEDDLEEVIDSEVKDKTRATTRKKTAAPKSYSTAEASAASTRTTKAKAPPRQGALTDLAAPFPSLSNKFSEDVVINMMLSLQGKLFAFKWKTFLMMLRVKMAVNREMGPSVGWRRNPKWLMQLLGRECASIWGHMGAARQLCNRLAAARKILCLLTLAATFTYRWTAVEVFRTGTPWNDCQTEQAWEMSEPFWTENRVPGAKECRRLREQVEKKVPDVIFIAPPTGPFSSWTRASTKDLREQKARYWPLWEMIHKLWQWQTRRGRLVYLQMPAGSHVPGPGEMQECYHAGGSELGTEGKIDWAAGDREAVYETQADLCMYEHRDPETLKFYKKAVKIETNDAAWSSWLGAHSRCTHGPGRHQEVVGFASGPDGQLCSRAELAGRWPRSWASRLLDTAQAALEARCCMPPDVTLHQECPGQVEWEEAEVDSYIPPDMTLHQECSGQVEWEAVPVEIENSPEGLLRQRLGEVTGDQYDYIYFEGHVSNAKLKRMLHLNGAKDHLLAAAGDLRCQVCQSVVPPRTVPRAAYDRPSRFNERVVVDVFFIWDSAKTKYAVVHAVDAFALYQVATLMHTARADLVGHFLKNYWIGVFGPPDVIMSDGGNEFAAETEGLLRAYDIFHEIVPPAAKWRMGLAERHGAVLKLLIMKTVQATTAKGYSETKECVMAATAARNRQSRISGFSPTQIVLGKDVAIPSSLLGQIEKGHFKYVLNQDLSFDEARRRNEQIRQAAEHAFVWADSSETLRRAINSRSRHPRLEMLYEGATVYYYDPPASRRGLPKRLQDQDSWSGPGVVAALERRDGAIRRVWIRYRSKLKGVPLEYVRLAALEEVESSRVCQQALQEVEKELQGGRPEVEEMVEPEVTNPDPPLLEFSGDEEEEAPAEPPPPASSLDDVPAQLHRDHSPLYRLPQAGQPPSKKVRFEEGKERTEEHLRKMKTRLQPEPASGARPTSAAPSSASTRPGPYSVPKAAPPQKPASHRGPGILYASAKWELEGAMRMQRCMLQEAKGDKWDVHASEAGRLTDEIVQAVDKLQVKPVPSQIEQPDAIDVYIDNQAVEPVPMEQMEQELEKARLKARWVLAGHLDKEAGKYATEGEHLSDERVVYIRMPRGYPEDVATHLLQRLGGRLPGGIRTDLVRLTKGGFGLSESPRLWYLRLRRGLIDVGLKELKLSPGTFVFHHRGELRGIVAVHVDDLRISFDPKFEYVLDKLRQAFSFGEWKSALTETVKFCGRWERQCAETFQVTVTMDGYAHKLVDPPQRAPGDRQPLTDAEKKWVASVGGQINWMARQGRADLAFGISKVQQMAGAKDPETLKALLQLVKKAREPYSCIFQALPGGFDDMIFLAVSDASHAAMPKGRSQGGMMILNASEKILDGEAQVNCLLYHSAVLKRVVRSSLAAEISQAAETLEQCDFVRAMMAEIVDVKFTLGQWLWSASRWREILVLDSKTGYDVLNSISHGEDKRLAIDIAILKESLYEPHSNRWVRWVPGMTMPSDGLTKEYGNPMRDAVMQGGTWSLRDSPEAQRLREEAGHRKRKCRDRAREREQEIEALRQATTAAPKGVGVKVGI
ncbi:psaC, partial [Symbiodinium necroappetens]